MSNVLVCDFCHRQIDPGAQRWVVQAWTETSARPDSKEEDLCYSCRAVIDSIVKQARPQ